MPSVPGEFLRGVSTSLLRARADAESAAVTFGSGSPSVGRFASFDISSLGERVCFCSAFCTRRRS